MATTTLYVCETCRFEANAREHEGRTGGEIFLAALAEQLHTAPRPDLQLKSTRCLMACSRHCSVHLRAPGKISYVIGDFTPDREAAATLLDYVGKYQQSESGQVPYNTWPPGIKGHFVARTPPLDEEDLR
jgi:predicted metal-binding protein